MTASGREVGKGGSEAGETSQILWQRGNLLGCGSFGQVHAGLDLATGQRIAVKEVRLSRRGGKRQMQQARALQREIRILAALDHPHIVRYLGTELARGCLRIFLELATDGSVKDAITQFGPLSEPLLRRYTADALRGLQFLHD